MAPQYSENIQIPHHTYAPIVSNLIVSSLLALSVPLLPTPQCPITPQLAFETPHNWSHHPPSQVKSQLQLPSVYDVLGLQAQSGHQPVTRQYLP